MHGDMALATRDPGLGMAIRQFRANQVVNRLDGHYASEEQLS